MYSRITVLCLVSIIIFMTSSCESAPLASTYQFLPPKPGYIPVYIRKGDTPLEEINLELAEAFKHMKNNPKTLKDNFVLTGIVEDGKTKFDYIPENNNILPKIDVE